jgi:transposase InsO family protein
MTGHIHCSRKRVARLMRQEGLKARRRRCYRVTTQAAEGHAVAPKLLDRRFTVTSTDEVWVGDLQQHETSHEQPGREIAEYL